ncbi:MAG TPA: 3'(2'),5'-bisphosphate nucleotidase CysQ [Polyangia bacterium]|nr:3'(2'),5'-bisphosphate nucleotidase CysQ [Polyangia bacterium]
MSLARELEVARAAALEAAALVQRYRTPGIRVDHKHEGEPVTEADIAASALIVERLHAAFPADAILSEEVPDDGSRLQASRVWMVDPIDGTRDFIRGENGYAVMIGLCIDGRPRVGVVSQPPTGITWAGSVGETCWKELPDGSRTGLRPSERKEPPGIRLVASKSHRTHDIDLFRKALGIDDEINVGGVGLKVALVAEGSRDLYVYPGSRTKLWDACAPDAIIAAAGGRLSDTYGDTLVYDQPDLYNRRGLIASNGRLHDLVVGTIALLRAKPIG